MQKANIKWDELGFSYQYVDNMYVSYWKDGKWDEGKIQDGDRISISIGATALHYGQECFEGLKAYSTKDGEIQLFRPDMNAKRLQDSCERLLMPEIPVEKFIDACKQVVKANEKYVPPYGTGATYYIRPFVIGCGDNIGVGPAPEYLFCIFGIPVGPYFKGGFKPVSMTTAKYDRAAPYGTGAAKVGGNYAGSMLPHKLANEEGYTDCIYLDPATHTKIEEAGAANFFGITKDNKFITPDSPSILPSITRNSLLTVAREYLGMEAIQEDILIDEIDKFTEVGACGTAAVIAPIGCINYKGEDHVFYSKEEAGPVITKLYETLYGIQFGDIKAPEGWIVKVK